MRMSFLMTFMANNSFVTLNLARNTVPKAPLPSCFRKIKSSREALLGRRDATIVDALLSISDPSKELLEMKAYLLVLAAFMEPASIKSKKDSLAGSISC